jgi:hypothetical protein
MAKRTTRTNGLPSPYVTVLVTQRHFDVAQLWRAAHASRCPQPGIVQFHLLLRVARRHKGGGADDRFDLGHLTPAVGPGGENLATGNEISSQTTPIALEHALMTTAVRRLTRGQDPYGRFRFRFSTGSTKG